MAQQLVSLDTRNKIKEFLREKARTQRPLTVEDVLKSIRSSVNRMLKRGYDYRDVVIAFSEYNVSVSVAVIETFYAPTKEEKGKGRPKKKLREKVPELEQPVSKEQLETIVARFQEMAKSRKGLNLQELVAELEEAIDEDVASGWRYEDIAHWIWEDFGIAIAPGTLKRYHTALKRHKSGEGEPEDQVGQEDSHNPLVATKQGQGEAGRRSRPAPVVSVNQQPMTTPSGGQRQARGEPTAVTKPRRLKELTSKDELEKEFNL